MKDLIDRKNEKERIARSIIKRWNVHYMTDVELKEQEELKEKEQEQEKELELANEIMARLEAEAAFDEALKQQEIEEAKKHQMGADTYNSATKSYSGLYGTETAADEETLEKINQILETQEHAFEENLQQTISKAQESETPPQSEEVLESESE